MPWQQFDQAYVHTWEDMTLGGTGTHSPDASVNALTGSSSRGFTFT